MDPLLTLDQVAERLNLSPRTIHKYVHDGKLVARKIGNKWQFKTSDVNAYIEAAESNDDAKKK